MNRFGSNYYENENEQFPENQRIGRQMGENAERPWNDSYRRPGNMHHSHPPYRPDHPYGYLPEHTGQPQRPYYRNQQMPYAPNDDIRRHHDDSIWTERNDFKDTDYRYRSGHRDQWHRDYDRKFEPEYRGDRRQPHDESFLNRVGDGIREGWNNLFHGEEPRDRHRHEDRNRHYEDRPQDRNQDRRDERRYGPEIERQRNYPHRNSDWKNSGPDHRDEDFIHPTNPRY